ncbi:nucleotide sugar dehydrogenase [Aeoliella sp.]|uniref:nucleotide sugar dehydrogenase n=1 Tax=Aeoliella sp. TaxID=2795800 RepID=UPI003CCBC93F
MKSLEDKIRNRSALVSVIGLGYVGLPLVREFVRGGFSVLGFDCDQEKVDQLQSGRSYIGHIPSEWIRECMENQSFQATADMDRLSEPDAIIVCVPTPLTESREPDLSYVTNTAAHIASRLRENQLIVLESTTYPGTTRDVLRPILQESGKLAGEDFFLAYSPEREDPGNSEFTSRSIPKLVAGCDESSLELACQLYANAFSTIVPVSSCEIAEASKILENTYRAVNIALVNELKKVFLKLDISIWEVIEAAKTKPFGYQAFYPGPGLGGHCIPIDPFYLGWLARRHDASTHFIELAGEINTSMPEFVVQRVSEALNSVAKPIKGSSICVLGVAYKRDVDDTRESPAFKVIELLAHHGAQVTFSDPYVDQIPKTRHRQIGDLRHSPLTPEYLRKQDCVVVVTDHSNVDYDLVAAHSSIIVDTRNVYKTRAAKSATIVPA